MKQKIAQGEQTQPQKQTKIADKQTKNKKSMAKQFRLGFYLVL